MERISDKKKCMASLAVFRELCNSEKDIYDVISEFVKQLILDKGLRTFDIQELGIKLNEAYGFELPSAVIKSALKRLHFLERNKSCYTVNDTFGNEESTKFQMLSENANQQNEIIIGSLISFVEQRRNIALNDQEKENLKIAFCSYVIDDMVNTDYGELISAFLITHKGEEKFITQLNQIKQGLILYVGLSYNANVDSVDAIDMPLHIYMEMEVLFSMVGYNGILFKKLFDEFYEQVEQINKRACKPIIQFHYFNETYNEISAYFNAAEQIVKGKMTLDPSKQAMTTIVKGCKDVYMVQEKRSKFMALLKSKGITLDDQECYYDKEQQSFNIEHGKFFENKNDEISDDDIERKLRLLNYINIKRGSKSQTIFRNVGHILLSANSLTFKIAFDSEIKKEKDVPLATSLEFLTNRFWLSLNKGLKADMNLRSFDIITKAQIVMSSRVSESIGCIFKEFEKEDKNGNFDKEEKKRLLASLHRKIVSPENVIDKDVDSYLNVISIDDIEKLNATLTLEEEQRKKEKEQHDIELKDAHEKEREVQKTLEIAAEKIVNSRNRESKLRYDNANAEYTRQINKYCKKKAKKMWCSSLCIVSLYSFAVLALALLANRYIEYEVWIIDLSKIASIFIVILAFIPPFYSHTTIKRSFAFCFKSMERKRWKERKLREYKSFNPEPQLLLCKKEEVLKELERQSHAEVKQKESIGQ